MSLLGDLGAPVTALSVLGTSRQENCQTTTDRQRPVGSEGWGVSLPRGDRILSQSTKDRDFCHQKTSQVLGCLVDKILDKNFNFQEP